MHKIVGLIALVILLGAASPARAGKVTSTMGAYTTGGAALGALLGSGGAIVSYINTGNSFDFVTGAGIGLVAGAGLGYLFGFIDLATGEPEPPVEAEPKAKEEETGGLKLVPAGTLVALGPSGPKVAFRFKF